MRRTGFNTLAILLAPAVLIVVGCGGHVAAAGANGMAAVVVQATTAHVETTATTHFAATLPSGDPAQVKWSVSGGDPAAGPGRISASGIYTPPAYLTQDSVTVKVSATLQAPDKDSVLKSTDTAQLTVTPGFLQPLTPGNVAVGLGTSVTVSGSITEVGGTGGIHFTLADGSSTTPRMEARRDGSGTLSAPRCTRGAVNGPNPAYTSCSVTYTAPAALPPSGSVFIVGSVANDSKISWTRVLLTASGVSSNPAAHQAHLAVPVALGSSSGNNSDYDSSGGQLSDCCGGTLGALLQDASGNQYVLSNNHVLARSDQSTPGETVIQPGLIDNGCTPYGVGPGTTPVAFLTGFPALSSPLTNVDAAIARVAPGAVEPHGNILELGSRQADGTLASAPLGLSSSGGKGEAASLGMAVAKSGRTTGLTCGAVSAVAVDVVVDYFTDCAETSHSLRKTFTNQIVLSGTSFSDAGDSGAIVVDTTNAEPVGLFFAGGTDSNGVEQAIASPIGDVLNSLDTQVPGTSGPTTYGLVGGSDHPVACLSYGGTRDKSALQPMAALPPGERERAIAAMSVAQTFVGPRNGIARMGLAASKDHPGEAALSVFVESSQSATAIVPAAIAGVSTVLMDSPVSYTEASQPRPVSFAQVLGVKQKRADMLLKTYPALFGVGVGQSLDNPHDAALILFVDRKKYAGGLPQTLDGQRVRVVLMDRLHVTRSHGTPVRSAGSCFVAPNAPGEDHSLRELFQDHIQLQD